MNGSTRIFVTMNNGPLRFAQVFPVRQANQSFSPKTGLFSGYVRTSKDSFRRSWLRLPKNGNYPITKEGIAAKDRPLRLTGCHLTTRYAYHSVPFQPIPAGGQTPIGIYTRYTPNPIHAFFTRYNRFSDAFT